MKLMRLVRKEPLVYVNSFCECIYFVTLATRNKLEYYLTKINQFNLCPFHFGVWSSAIYL